MTGSSMPAYLFGDLLALARQSWIAQMRDGLRERGHPGYRRSDALVLRLLRRGPMALGRLGDALGVTRQAARKIADGLALRGLATTDRDARDARQINVTLTGDGQAYAQVVVEVIDRLNRDLRGQVAAADLAAADTVLRAVLADDRSRTLATHILLPQRPDEAEP